MKNNPFLLTDPAQIEAILRDGQVCRLGMIAQGRPYIVPLSYGYFWEQGTLVLSFPSGHEGRKMTVMRHAPQVCFEIDIAGHLTGEGGPACGYSYTYRSILGDGVVEFAQTDAQKEHGLHAIMAHYTGKHEGWTYPKRALDKTAVFFVRATHFEAACKPRPTQQGERT